MSATSAHVTGPTLVRTSAASGGSELSARHVRSAANARACCSAPPQQATSVVVYFLLTPLYLSGNPAIDIGQCRELLICCVELPEAVRELPDLSYCAELQACRDTGTRRISASASQLREVVCRSSKLPQVVGWPMVQRAGARRGAVCVHNG